LSTLQVVLYTRLAGLVLVFLAGAFTSLVATRFRKPLVERTGGDIAFAAFAVAVPTTVAAVTNNGKVLAAGSLVALVLMLGMFVWSPRCVRCGERLNPLTNRQFRRPRCLFCGAPEK